MGAQHFRLFVSWATLKYLLTYRWPIFSIVLPLLFYEFKKSNKDLKFAATVRQYALQRFTMTDSTTPPSGGSASAKLLHTQVRVMKKSACTRRYRRFKQITITDKVLCARSPGKDSCQVRSLQGNAGDVICCIPVPYP